MFKSDFNSQCQICPVLLTSKFLHRYFYLINRPHQPWPCYQNSFHQNSYTVKFKVSIVEWQCQNDASVHRPAKEFTDDHKRVREWCQCYSILKGQTCGVLGKCSLYAVTNLCQSILTIKFLEDKKRRQISVKLVSFPDPFFTTWEQ